MEQRVESIARHYKTADYAAPQWASCPDADILELLPVATYTIHEPPHSPADRIGRAETLVFVKDGFSWGAALVPPLWLVTRGEWMALAAYAAAAAVLAGVLAALGAHSEWVVLAVLAFNVLFGFEASALRGWLLARSGWREIATVSGKTRDECERRFFDAWQLSQPAMLPRDPHAPAERFSASGAAWQRVLGRLRDWQSLIGVKP